MKNDYFKAIIWRGYLQEQIHGFEDSFLV